MNLSRKKSYFTLRWQTKLAESIQASRNNLTKSDRQGSIHRGLDHTLATQARAGRCGSLCLWKPESCLEAQPPSAWARSSEQWKTLPQTGWKGRTDTHKLSSDSHTRILTQCAPTNCAYIHPTPPLFPRRIQRQVWKDCWSKRKRMTGLASGQWKGRHCSAFT